MIYREFRPSPALRPIVERLWWLEGPAEMIGGEPIPPDGHAEIIVHGGDPFASVAADGASTVQERVMLAGQATRAVHVAPRGYARMVGARLSASGAHALFRLPQSELTDQIADLHVVDRALARRLRDDVASRESGEEMVAALDRALASAMPSARPAPSPAARATALARARRGLMRVGDLASHLDLSARQIERVFRDEVGISPKLFLRIVRFQEVLGAIRGGAGETGWAEVAAGHGFYDQAHFIRDFKTFAGRPPGSWHVGDASLASIFSALGRDQEISP